jgi:hypothetical protein
MRVLNTIITLSIVGSIASLIWSLAPNKTEQHTSTVPSVVCNESGECK